MKKRIGINAVVLNPQSGGLGVYMRHLIDYFLNNEQDFDPVIFLAHNNGLYDPKPGSRLQFLNLSATHPVSRIALEPFTWPRAISQHKIDCLHSPMSYIPFGVRVPAVVTIHDLRSFHFPEAYGRVRRLYLGKMIRRSVQKAIRILTISEFTRNDIVETFGVSPEKVAVIYEGVDVEKFHREYGFEELALIRERYHLPQKYILTVGHLEPRKNYPRLINAFHLLITRHNVEHSLVIVGRENWDFQQLYMLVDRLGLEGKIIFTRFTNDQDLPAIYQMADVFIAPSLFEGFGFTPLESMAAGTPVAAASCTSLPEVVGDAALLFDPLEVEDMADKMLALLTDETLKESLVERGYRNVRRFRWSNCCRQTAVEFDKILQQL